jgi:hypothetical protein
MPVLRLKSVVFHLGRAHILERGGMEKVFISLFARI